jgi:arylsulfatase A-like enzyme
VTRRGLLLVLIASGLGCARPPSRVVLITIDTLRADHVGPRGTTGASLTPSLDALARDGVSYADAISNCTVTRCSHVSLLTGQYPWRHGVLDNSARVREPLGLPQRLQGLGFATGAVASSLPVKDLGPGFDWTHANFPDVEAGTRKAPVKRPEQTNQAALQFLERNRERPFFLWVHYFPPHGPYTPPASFLRGLEQADGERLAPSERNYEKGRIPAYQVQADAPDAGEYRRRYAGHVRYVDAFVGRLLDRLKEDGLYDDALIVATSDHGESLGEHGWYFLHGNLAYQEQARVPLVIKWPRGAHAGLRVDAPVELVDVAPTIAESAGASGLAADGAPLPRGPRGERRPRYTQSNDAELAAVFDGPWKLIWKRGPTAYTDAGHPGLELFHLERDPGEAADLSAAQPERARRLLEGLRRRYSDVPSSAAPRSPELEEQLRALGYIN